MQTQADMVVEKNHTKHGRKAVSYLKKVTDLLGSIFKRFLFDGLKISGHFEREVNRNQSFRLPSDVTVCSHLVYDLPRASPPSPECLLLRQVPD